MSPKTNTFHRVFLFLQEDHAGNPKYLQIIDYMLKYRLKTMKFFKLNIYTDTKN